jgi:hypothetical protein
MKVRKSFLSRIIKEEIKKALYENEDEAKKHNALKRIDQMKSASRGDTLNGVERKLTHLFIQYRNYITKNPTDNKDDLPNFEKSIRQVAPGLKPEDIVDMLEGKIDRQLFSFIKTVLLRDRNMKTQSDKLDNYEMSISPDEQNVYKVYNKQDSDPGFMRVPKDDEAYDQEDVRKDRKTLTQS